MKTTYEQIVNNNPEHLKDIVIWGESENVALATVDRQRVMLLVIDVQNDFMEGGTLAVPGAKADAERLTRFMYENLTRISQVVCSIDTHSLAQIFHACWWQDAAGDQPAPFTMITYSDALAGKCNPVYYKEESIEYLRNLESLGQKQLCIWPYHCLAGSYGAEMEASFTNMLYFHSAARKSAPMLVQKGQNPLTEMYGIIKAEYDTENYVNRDLLDAIKQYDEVYIAGEASSHCVLASANQIMEHFADKPEITSRITLLSDCTSPIPSFEEVTDRAFKALSEKYGMRIERSTNIKL